MDKKPASNISHPLAHVAEIARGQFDLHFTIMPQLPMVQLFAKRPHQAAVCKRLKISDTPGHATTNTEMDILPLSPGQWLVKSKKQDEQFGAKIAKKIYGIGHVSEQSSSRVWIKVSGDQAKDFLSRGCRLDLSPTNAESGYCAQTTIAQIGVVIHVPDDEPSFNLYVYSGFARSFWEFVTHTSHQFGYSVTN